MTAPPVSPAGCTATTDSSPLELKFEGLFGLLLKSDSIKESVIAQRDLESKEKRIFFFSCQSMVHKKNQTLANGIAEL